MKLTERLPEADDFQKKDSSQVSLDQDGAILWNPKGNQMAREAVVVTSLGGGGSPAVFRRRTVNLRDTWNIATTL